MQLSYTALVAAALGLQCALGQPAHRRHQHKHKRAHPEAIQARDVDWNNKDLYKDVDWSKVFNVPKEQVENTTDATDETQSEVQEESQPVPTPESTPAPPAPTESSQPKPTPSVEPSKGSGSAKGFGGISEPVDDGNQDHYIGNVGIPYGSNMILIDESEKGNHKYTLTLTNINNADTTYIVWNKSGKDGQPQSGMGLEPNLKFTVSPRQAQVIAFDENSQVSFSRDCPRNQLGGNLPDCTWGEADFGDLRNGGWSGYDCSSIPNSKGNVDYCKMSCEGAKTSSHDYNSFTDVSQTNAGGSLAPGPVAFYAEL